MLTRRGAAAQIRSETQQTAAELLKKFEALPAKVLRSELGLRRRDGREDELPPRRARVQLAAGDQGRRADAGVRRRRRDEESQQAALRHRVLVATPL